MIGVSGRSFFVGIDGPERSSLRHTGEVARNIYTNGDGHQALPPTFRQGIFARVVTGHRKEDPKASFNKDDHTLVITLAGRHLPQFVQVENIHPPELGQELGAIVVHEIR